MYKLSTDYSKAYKDLYVGGFLICFVDFRFRGEPSTESPSRDICMCKLKQYEISFTARGIEYGSIDLRHNVFGLKNKNKSDEEIQKDFEKECERMKASFLLF